MPDGDPHIAAYQALLAAPCEPPPGLHGDGIIYSLWERGDRAHVGVGIGLRLLRDVCNWQGRIQVWHHGDHPKICKNYEVEFIDSRAVQAAHGGNNTGWASKSFCLRHSGLRRGCICDWDCHCVANPAALFSLLDRYAMVYWVGRQAEPEGTWAYNPTIFDAFGLRDKARIAGAVQGGFMLVNCETYWRAVLLQRLYDDASDWWYPRNRGVDEEGWRLALSLLPEPTLQAGPLAWDWPAWVNWHQDVSYAVHRCNGKLWPDSLPHWNYNLPREHLVERLYRMLIGPRYEALERAATETREQRHTRLRRERRAALTR